MVALGDLVKTLNAAFESKDYESCEKIIPAVKLELIKNKIFLPDFTNTNEQYINDLNITKRILEIGALTNIFLSRNEAFENDFTQLRTFYFCKNEKLANSENKSKIICLYLLVLRSDGDVTKFHSELEYLDRHIPNLEDDKLLSYPIKVDRWLMEGLYQRAWELLDAGLNIPEFDVFNMTLMTAIRDEIAHSTEMAYQELPLSSIKTLLFLDNEKDVETVADDRGWTVSNGIVKFNQEDEDDEDEDDIDDGFENDGLDFNKTARDRLKVIDNTLDYAISLETIV
ncbi:regulatory particle non-ATPase [Maudiozyma exigua]|uniref:Regulatory particle non-ATPase n=1 Tax=Maudiozyma exigua TaxID=34358 RepID=A0A9P6W0F9_MAUEX|nr:regulatory particle non-ATPase [Kazachstania exigua]